MAREMTPQERAAQLYGSLTCTTYREGYQDPDNDIALIADVLQDTRRAALLEIRQFCVDYEDCCVLGLVAHADKAVTNASISTMQFIKRHIDDRLAQEG